MIIVEGLFMKIKTFVFKFCLIFLLTSLFIWVLKHSDNNVEYLAVKQNNEKYLLVDELFSSPAIEDEYENQNNYVINERMEIKDTKEESTKTKIHIAPGKSSTYYHIRFSLTPDNTVLTVPLSERTPQYSNNNDYVFAEGGQFEVFVERDKFPIPSPHSKRKYLILRMPWTDISMKKADRSIAEKYDLFIQIKEMVESQKGSVEVTIELNPFVNVLSENPLQLELSNRNIFFRQAYGRYIDFVGPLKSN